MPCYHLLTAYQCSDGSVVFQELRGRDVVRILQLPCGQCIGCRLERSRQWAVRCLHEAQLHESNCYITLTYDDVHLPEALSLNYRDFQLFMKRLRKSAPGVRFFACGEYGEDFGRPHFHACLFNYDFSDKVYFMRSDSGERLYRSASLERLWPFGFSTVGRVTFQSAAYVARYICKKVNGDEAAEHYGRRVSEFVHMSLKPGIGSRWIDKFMSDVYPDGEVVVNGVKVLSPKYYDRRYKKYCDRIGSEGYDDLCFNRDTRARAKYQDNTDERLAVKEQVATARASFLGRKLK